MRKKVKMPAAYGAAGTVVPNRPNNPASLPFSDLLDAFLAQWRGRDSAMQTRCEWWRSYFGAKPINEITDDDVAAALDVLASEPATTFLRTKGKPSYRQRGKRSGPTCNRYLAALASVLKFAQRKRLLARGWQNLVAMIAKHPERPGIVRFLTPDERKRLLATCRVSRWSRLYVLVLLAMTTAARRGELQRLRWADIDLEAGRATVHLTKNDQPKVMALTPPVVAELRRFVGRPDELVFCSARLPDRPMCFESHWRHALLAAKIERFRFHDLRHTTASYLPQQGASLLEIADVTGHKSLAMVQRYAHLSIESRAKLVHKVLGDLK
jgi:integrase